MINSRLQSMLGFASHRKRILLVQNQSFPYMHCNLFESKTIGYASYLHLRSSMLILIKIRHLLSGTRIWQRRFTFRPRTNKWWCYRPELHKVIFKENSSNVSFSYRFSLKYIFIATVQWKFEDALHFLIASFIQKYREIQKLNNSPTYLISLSLKYACIWVQQNEVKLLFVAYDFNVTCYNMPARTINDL